MTEDETEAAPGLAAPSGPQRLGGWRRIAWRIVRVLLLAYLGTLLVLWMFQERFLYFPDTELVAAPADYGLACEDVHLTAADGTKLHGWFVPAEDARAVVLFCHGNAGNISHRLDTAAIFHRLGCSVLLFDYRGYGRSNGRPSEDGTYQDARAAWDGLVQQPGVRPGDVLIAGRSLGGAVAAELATHVQPRGLILESTFTSVPDRAAEMLWFLPIRWLCRLDYSTRSRLAQIACPILIVHSRDDELIPFHHGRALFGAAREPKTFAEIHGGHNDGFLASEPVYAQALRQFLDATAAREEPTGDRHRDRGPAAPGPAE